MNIAVFPSGPFATNAYVLFCEETKRAAIIDPAPESAEPLSDYIAEHKLGVEKVLLTHSHWDHFADLAKICKLFATSAYIHSLDAQNLIKPGSDGLPMFLHVEPYRPENLIKDKDSISVGQLKLEVIHTPGHSPGGVCFYCPSKKILISGDTLFKGSIGNLSFPTAEPQKMWMSLKRLAQLPVDTAVYPGHGAMTYIREEPWLENAEKLFN